MSHTIAYIMSRFPHLPETFILREMTELERHGWHIALCPLILQTQTVMHAAARPWLERAYRLHILSPTLLAANVSTLVQRPHHIIDTYGRALAENSSHRGFLLRTAMLLPKAAHAALLMRRAGIQHIHAHYATHPALVAWLIYRLTGIRYSVTVHAHDIFVRQEMLATKMRDAVAIVAISHYNRDYLARTIGAWVCEKTHIIHCGVEPEMYTPRSSVERQPGPFELLSIGSLQPYKGQRYLIEACAQLRDQGVPFRCRIVGGGEDVAVAALQHLIDRNNLHGCVELLGPQPQEEVARLLPQADCYVQPSVQTETGKMEGIPVALMEALACELPVVATNISGIPELVRHGHTGYLVPPADATALAEQIIHVCRTPTEAARQAQAGRQLVLSEFALKSNVERLSALFERIVAKGLLLR